MLAEINGTLDATLTCNFDGAARLDGGRPRLVRDERQLAEEPALRYMNIIHFFNLSYVQGI